MAFAEQFIYLCLRHFWVLQAASHRFLSGSDTFSIDLSIDFNIEKLRENQQESVPKIIKQTIRTIKEKTFQETSDRVKEDNCITDRTSGGVAAYAACARDFSLFTAKASVLTDTCSRSAPLVNGVRA